MITAYNTIISSITEGSVKSPFHLPMEKWPIIRSLFEQFTFPIDETIYYTQSHDELLSIKGTLRVGALRATETSLKGRISGIINIHYRPKIYCRSLQEVISVVNKYIPLHFLAGSLRASLGNTLLRQVTLPEIPEQGNSGWELDIPLAMTMYSKYIEFYPEDFTPGKPFYGDAAVQFPLEVSRYYEI